MKIRNPNTKEYKVADYENCYNKENLCWTYNEIKGDLFEHCEQEDRYAVHCISADHVMGGGIAVPMAKKFDLRKAFELYDRLIVGEAYLVGKSFSLVTKDNACDKPTYNDLYYSLADLFEKCKKFGIKKLVMPKIGCGIDGLDWDKVRDIIKEVFGSIDIDILVCTL